MRKRMNLAHRTAVVTGAASGIGRALAISLAQRRCHLILADINEPGLQRTAELAATPGLRITSHYLDVADPMAVSLFPDTVRETHPGVDLLFNNAGVAVRGTFEQVSDMEFEWLFGINFRGVVRMTRAFLPMLRASDDARIVNLSSVFGLIAPAGQTAYSASKFAVRGFSEALRHELEDTSVGVTVVHPGGIATSIAESARTAAGISAQELASSLAQARRALRLPPATASEIIVRAVERRKARVLVGADAQIIAALERVVPVSYWDVLKRLIPR